MSNTKYFEEDLQQLAMPQLLINTLFCVLSLQTKSIIEFSVLISLSCGLLVYVKKSHAEANLGAF